MSRLAKKPITIALGISATRDGDFVVLKGSTGEKRLAIHPATKVKIEADKIFVEAAHEAADPNVGTMWALIKNAAEGVSGGFSKTLDMEGVGYRASFDGKDLTLSLGYAEPVRFNIPSGIAIEVEKNTIIRVSGSDKELVGRVAADIRALKKPEPYKGKGIRYRGEIIRRKVGKKAGAAAGAAGA